MGCRRIVCASRPLLLLSVLSAAIPVYPILVPQDWCISRQLWWGHRIPVWYVFPSEAAAAAAPEGRCDTYVVARNEADAKRLAEERHGPGCVLRQV